MKLYLCGSAYQHELAECDFTVFESIERLKQMNKCWKTCGIVELQLSIQKVTWVEDQNLFPKKKRKKK